MREIKFRVWLPHHKEMVFDILVGCDNIAIVGKQHKGKIIDNHKVMQYTGLKDKNGKEIYEGDIAHTNSKYKNKTDWTGVVKWSNEHCGFIVELENGKHWMPISEAEVIGNIYEHEHLL